MVWKFDVHQAAIFVRTGNHMIACLKSKICHDTYLREVFDD